MRGSAPRFTKSGLSGPHFMASGIHIRPFERGDRGISDEDRARRPIGAFVRAAAASRESEQVLQGRARLDLHGLLAPAEDAGAGLSFEARALALHADPRAFPEADDGRVVL